MRVAPILLLAVLCGCETQYRDTPLTLTEAQEVYETSLAELERLSIEQRDAVDRGNDSLAAAIGKKIDAESKRGWKAYERVKRLKAEQ